MNNCKNENCRHDKWSHWSNGIIGKCSIPGCDCPFYMGNIPRVNMSIRKELETKYGIIRKVKIKHNMEESPWSL